VDDTGAWPWLVDCYFTTELLNMRVQALFVGDPFALLAQFIFNPGRSHPQWCLMNPYIIANSDMHQNIC
jgi:hypothetical protein